MKVIKTSSLIIYNDKGQILMQNRESISKHGEQRSFFGGHLEEGETFEQGLEREIKEELGIELNGYEFFAKVTRPDNIFKGVFRETNSYIIKTDKTASEFTVYEGDYCQFFAFKEIPELNTFPLTKHLARMFDEYININYK